MNVTDKTTKTVATNRKATAHILTALAVMSVIMGATFIALNLIMDPIFALLTTFAIIFAVLYVAAIIFAPGAMVRVKR